MASKVKKRKKLNVKNLFILILFISLIGFGVNYVVNLRVKNILIKGTEIVRDVDVIRIAGLVDYPKILKINSKKMEQEILKLDLVDEVKVKKNFLGQVTIEIEESTPLLYAYNRGSVILSNGREIESKDYYGLATMINYVPDDVMSLLIKGLMKVDKDVVKMISEIEYYPSLNDLGEIIDNTRFILYMSDGNMVHMNTINIEKLSNYMLIYDEIGRQYGDVRGVIKLDSATDAYIFKSFDGIKEDEEVES